jgi:hypothetical protein
MIIGTDTVPLLLQESFELGKIALGHTVAPLCQEAIPHGPEEVPVLVKTGGLLSQKKGVYGLAQAVSWL